MSNNENDAKGEKRKKSQTEITKYVLEKVKDKASPPEAAAPVPTTPAAEDPEANPSADDGENS